jgi:GNAT superfamily N-acetyltransferase
MPDMLVKLYDLQVDWPALTHLESQGIYLRKPLGSEIGLISDWVKQNFSPGWASEVTLAASQRPATCFLAVQARQLLGFACYDAAALGLFGPMGIAEMHRGKGVGRALLQLTLYDMKQKGYGYAIIGWVGPTEFYARNVGAVMIPDSSPGIWHTSLHPQKI